MTATASQTIATADAQLNRAIGLKGATLLVIGNVIGSGIFLTTGVMFEQLPSTTLVLLAWVAGGLLAVAGGLTYAEMGSMFPRSGGLYVYLSEAYGSVWGFLFGWACLLVILTGSVAAVAVGFAEYFSYFVPALGTDRLLLVAADAVGRLEHLGRPGRRRHVHRDHHGDQLRRHRRAATSRSRS